MKRPDFADEVNAMIDQAALGGHGVYIELHSAEACEKHHAELVRGASDVAEIVMGIMKAKGIAMYLPGWIDHPEIVVRLYVHRN